MWYTWGFVRGCRVTRESGICQLRFRKVARMRKIAKSATDSEDAAALIDVRNYSS